ncbi:MAG: cation:proton antiporter [Flavobacteriales bacterium]|nr:MAG: cation:proton antiporter [Flavobacteriales bacterium]
MSVNEYLYVVILPILAISVLLVFIRFIKGPGISDRIVALDLLITIGIGIMSVYAIVSEKSSFLDIAMIFALIAFLGTIAFGYYLEKRKRDD